MNNRSLTIKLKGLLSPIRLIRLISPIRPIRPISPISPICPISPIRPISLICLISLLLSSCERRPLEVYYEPAAIVRVELDWLDHFGQKPNGMLMLIYDANDSIYKAVGPTSEVEAQTLTLGVGTYKLVFCSYPDMETYSFQRLGNHFHASARSSLFKGHKYDYWETDKESEAPEDIGAAVDTITITPEMVNGDLQFIDYRDRNNHGSDTVNYVFYEVPDPMTVTLYVRAKVKRRHSIKSIDATISGMADGFYLSRIDRTTERATLFMPNEDWQKEKYGAEKDSMGIISTKIASFGLPHGKELLAERDSADNVLTFHFVLVNDSVKDISFKVGKDIRYLTPEGREAQIRKRQDLHDLKIELDLSEIIVMPPTPVTRNGQGFDAIVDDWDDGGTYDLGGF